MSFATIILAAGQGKRMQSSLPKPLHRLGGKPLLAWVLDSSFAAGAEKQIVITPQDNMQIAGLIRDYADRQEADVTTAIQHPPKGTGHAVECAAEALDGYDGVVIVAFADTPLV
ncbi:MAG: bifunctional UDP-N-acetylglucosamine diphosphorylase/glucosamine-1-phosphate N-acetyltransferase GlmU, partial [Alphaproteobacteria bacterium]|nr:bifunctional UDP-N-acetylglucosamine diphosphorylase/glucosamine-1-phosphate N-acetyltransferase GlmU [Alphaproteobacteria bacterium]